MLVCTSERPAVLLEDMTVVVACFILAGQAALGVAVQKQGPVPT